MKQRGSRQVITSYSRAWTAFLQPLPSFVPPYGLEMCPVRRQFTRFLQLTSDHLIQSVYHWNADSYWCKPTWLCQIRLIRKYCSKHSTGQCSRPPERRNLIKHSSLIHPKEMRKNLHEAKSVLMSM